MVHLSATYDTLDIFGDGSCRSLYKFNGNANDETDSYNATASNITYYNNNYGIANFNGTNSKIALPSGSPFNDSNTIKSIGAWIKP